MGDSDGVVMPSPTRLCSNANDFESVRSGLVSDPVTILVMRSRRLRSNVLPDRGYDVRSVVWGRILGGGGTEHDDCGICFGIL